MDLYSVHLNLKNIEKFLNVQSNLGFKFYENREKWENHILYPIQELHEDSQQAISVLEHYLDLEKSDFQKQKFQIKQNLDTELINLD
jgi:uncharacterized protein (DUF2461 family)